jgi:hypothetical protein
MAVVAAAVQAVPVLAEAAEETMETMAAVEAAVQAVPVLAEAAEETMETMAVVVAAVPVSFDYCIGGTFAFAFLGSILHRRVLLRHRRVLLRCYRLSIPLADNMYARSFVPCTIAFRI